MARPRAYCSRCDEPVAVDRVSAGWHVAKNIWLVCAALCALVTPIIAADAFFLTPLVVAFLMGGGFIYEQTERAPTCRQCGGPIGSLGQSPDDSSKREEPMS